METDIQYADAREQKFFDCLAQSITEHDVLLYSGFLLQRAAQLAPNTTALIGKNESVSYQDLYHQSLVITAYVQQHGIKPRDRVLICLENSIDFYRIYFGVWQAGAVVAPLNTFLHEAELTHIVHDAQPAAIFCDETKRELFTKLVQERSILVVGSMQITEILTTKSDKNPSLIALDAHEMSALLYTSGTTGLPKGVMLSSSNIMSNILQTVARLQYTSTERVLGILPLFHSFAQLASIWGAFFACCTVIVVPRIDRRFIIDSLVHQPTFFLGVPALYGLLCLLKDLDFSAIKYFICGGDMLPDKIRTAFALLYNRKLVNGYGMTETSPLISVDFEDQLRQTGNVGLPCLHISCQIRDEQLRPLPHHQIGTLWVKGPNIMLGYYRAPEITKEVLQDGWLNTGDLAYITASKRIVIVGRSKDIIIHKGLKIYPPEVENVIAKHINVMAVGVIGVKQKSGDEIPVAFVQLREGDDQAPDLLKELCNRSLASYKIPRLFICSVERLVLTATGKVDKKVLRARDISDQLDRLSGMQRD